MERGNPFQQIIDLSSDEEVKQQKKRKLKPSRFLTSSSQLHPSSQLNSTHKNNNPSPNLPNFQEILSFDKLYRLNSLQNHQNELAQFLEYKDFNVLFLFGPSGCGKTLLTQKLLSYNGIPFTYASPKTTQNEDGDTFIQDIFEMISDILPGRGSQPQKVNIFKEFPIGISQCGMDYLQKYKHFRQSAFRIMGDIVKGSKSIFILNTQIYNPYYILNQSSKQKSLRSLVNVKVIQMNPYSITQIKKIISHFISQHPKYSSHVNSANDLDQVAIEANGDARKAFNLIYHRALNQIARQNSVRSNSWDMDNSISCSNRIQLQSLKEDSKVTIFHMLGKFLYGKRKNLCYNPKSRIKTQKQISCYYSQSELIKQDPPFYFKPTELFDRSHMTLQVFSELLQQNYIQRYGSTKDMAKMSQIFIFYDSYLGGSLNRFQLIDRMEQLVKELHTWGILIYNKNSIRGGNMYKIQRSRNNTNQQTIKLKYQLLKAYYTRTKESGKYRVRDIIDFAFLTANSKYKAQYPSLHQKLIDLILDNRKSAFLPQIDSHQNVINDQDQEIAYQSTNKVVHLGQSISIEVNRLKSRAQAIQMLMQDIEEAEIDSD